MLDPFRDPTFIQSANEWNALSFSFTGQNTLELSITAKWAREMIYPRSYVHEIDLDIVGEFPSSREEVAISVDFRLPSFVSVIYPTEAGIVLQRFGGSYGPLKFITATKGIGEGNMELVLINEHRAEVGVLLLPVSVHSPSIPNEEKL